MTEWIKEVKKVPFMEEGDFVVIKKQTTKPSSRETIIVEKICRFLKEYEHLMAFKEMDTGFTFCINEGDLMCGEFIIGQVL